MKNSLETKLADSWPPDLWRDVTVLLAVSGGPDSVALLRSMLALKPLGAGRLVVGPVNHGGRGRASDEDETFVVELCRGYKLECLVGRPPKDSAERAGPKGEDHARTLRYRFLKTSARQLGARYVVTAHTADDQAETILHRVIRGTGVKGLAGIPRTRRLGHGLVLIRPLLGVRRVEMMSYLEELGQGSRHDASNQDLRFTRNRIRHELLPQLAGQYNPGFTEALLRLGGLAGEAQDVMNDLVGRFLEQVIVRQADDAVELDCRLLAGQRPYLVRELLATVWRAQGWPLQAMGFEEWNRLARMVLAIGDAATEQQVIPGNICAGRQGERLTLSRVESGLARG